MTQVKATLARIAPLIDHADFDLLQRLVTTFAWVTKLLRAQRTTLARLRRFLGLSSSEKTADVLPDKKPGSPKDEPSDGTSPADDRSAAGDSDKNGDHGTVPDAESEKPKAKKGHGRVAAADYSAAEHIPVAHESLSIGSRCPGCGAGKLFELQEPARILRIFGQPSLTARCWDCQRLRCGGCGHVYTAHTPTEAQGPKYDETAVSMIALYRYDAGLPHSRLDRLQRDLATPVPSSTQWDVLDDNAPTFRPIVNELARQGAQGKVVHNDDTYVRILEFMGKRRAKLLKNGELPDPDRTGLFTTAIVSITDDGPIALFYTGRQHAGENLADLLVEREPNLNPPILMSDALSRNVPKGHSVVESNCVTHARRGFVDEVESFPSECEYLLKQLRRVYSTERQCKGLSPEERLRLHQRNSGPVMKELNEWMTAQFADKRVEPNSGLGKAMSYMLTRWSKFTLFLRQAGAPLDNNISERVLKKSICHRRNSLFYRSQHGADVGDMFMSLIHTAEIRGANPFDYLTEVQRHPKAVQENPAQWLPWNYRATLARLADHEASAGDASPPRPPAP
jgi:transposase